MRLALFAPLLFASCVTSPAVHSPLKERLAKADNSQLEDATRACLTQGGWKVDPIAELVAGARRVNATKDKELTEVYINPADMTPRITGGPDYSDAFWKCLGSELGGKKTEPAAPSS